MSVFRNAVFLAALAGLVAGLVLAAMQAATTAPLIAQAEVFEQGASEPAPADAAHSHADSTAPSSEEAAAGHDHGEAWAPEDGLQRAAFSILASIAAGIGFALVLVVVSEFAGGLTGWRNGMIWGLAGFAVFVLAPGLGLPPELPAMPAADLYSRQIWWLATVLATAGGLGLIAFSRNAALAVLAVALIVVPHIVGAPQPVSHESPIPEALHHEFIVRVTMTNLVFWLVLGATAGVLRPRFFAAAENGGARLNLA